jgi:hypothetical protein
MSSVTGVRMRLKAAEALKPSSRQARLPCVGLVSWDVGIASQIDGEALVCEPCSDSGSEPKPAALFQSAHRLIEFPPRQPFHLQSTSKPSLGQSKKKFCADLLIYAS